MHVISLKKLRQFWARRPEAEGPLRAWHQAMEREHWEGFAELRIRFPSADQVGKFTVFNLGGNKYRLIAAIHYNRGKVFVRHVLTHQEYDRGHWKSD